MKTYRYIFFVMVVGFGLASCDHDVAMETTVHEDGSLDKVIVFENEDSTKNILGLSDKNGWVKSVKKAGSKNDSAKNNDVIVIYRKSFPSTKDSMKSWLLLTIHCFAYQLSSKRSSGGFIRISVMQIRIILLIG